MLEDVRDLMMRVGEVDHVVWTSGDAPDPKKFTFPQGEIEECKGRHLRSSIIKLELLFSTSARYVRRALLGSHRSRKVCEVQTRRIVNSYDWSEYYKNQFYKH